MTDKCNLGLAGYLLNFGEEGWDVVPTHLLEAKVPELLTVDAVILIFKGVLAASIVAEPDIVSLVGQEKGNTVLISIDHQVISRADESMLNE